jgi:hypothetical protein
VVQQRQGIARSQWRGITKRRPQRVRPRRIKNIRHLFLPPNPGGQILTHARRPILDAAIILSGQSLSQAGSAAQCISARKDEGIIIW